ncbi:MAG: hypothetical protein ACRCST_02300, partial [Turicibacter sp.]
MSYKKSFLWNIIILITFYVCSIKTEKHDLFLCLELNKTTNDQFDSEMYELSKLIVQTPYFLAYHSNVYILWFDLSETDPGVYFEKWIDENNTSYKIKGHYDESKATINRRNKDQFFSSPTSCLNNAQNPIFVWSFDISRIG